MTTPTTLPEALTEIEELRGQVRELLQLLRQDAQQENGTGHPVRPSRTTMDGRDRDSAELAQQQSESDFRAMIENSSDIITVLDLDGTIRFESPSFERLLGYAQHEIDGRIAFDFIHPEDLPTVIEKFQRIVQRPGETQTAEFRFRHKDGSWRSFEGVGRATCDSQSRSCVIVNSRDISERKRAERSMLQARDFLTSFVEHTPAAVAMLDRELRYVAVSRRWLTDYRLGDEPLVGRRHYDVFPEIQAMKEWQDIHHRCLSGSVERREEDRFVRADGSEDWLRWEVRPWHDITGEVGGIIMFTEVITERKQAEAALRVSDERLALAVEGSTDILWDAHRLPGEPWYTPQTPIWWSPRVRGLLDLEESELFETLEHWAMRLHPDDKDWVFGKLAAHIEHRVPYDAEYRLRTNRGDYLWIRARGQASWDEQGEIRRMSGSCQDITERKQAQEKRYQSEAQLRAILDNSPSLIFLKDLDGRYLRVNRKFETLFCMTEEEIVGRTDRDIFPPEQAAVYQGNDAKVLREGVPMLFEEVAVHGNNPHVSISHKFPLCDKEGALYAIGGIATDITERKRAEDALRRREETLARFKATLDQTHDCVFMFASDTLRFIYCNRGAVEQVGYSEAELFTMTPLDLKSEFTERSFREMLQQLKDGRMNSHVFETIHRHKDGHDVAVEVSLQLVREEGEEGCFLAVVRDITERKQAEATLQQSEAHFRALIENSSDIITVLDLDGTIRFESPSFERLLGYAQHEIDGRIAFDFIDPDDLPAVLEKFQLIVQRPGETQIAEFRFRHKDGSWRWFEGVGRAAGDAQGRPCVIANSRDITERKRTDERLLLTQFSVDRASDAVLWMDSGASILNVNEAACRLLEYTRDELTAMTVHDIDPSVSLESWPDHWEEFKQKGSLTFESKYWSKNGRVVDAEVTVNYLRYDGNEFNCAILRDIGERKRAIEALRESEERFSKAFNEAAIGMALVGTDGRWLQVNRALCNIVGYSKEELEATNFQAVTHPDDLDADLTLLRQLLKGEISTYQMEKRYLHKQGHIVWIVLSVSLVRHPNGEPQHLISQMQDITDRKQAEEALALSERRLRTVLDTLPVGVWFTDSAGRVQFGNPASHRIWGGAAYIGLPHQGKEEWWEPSAGGYVPHRWALAGALSNGESSFQDKMMLRYVDGTTKIIMNTSVPVRGDAGQVMGAIVVTEDITESTRLAQREAARIEQLRQLSELSLTLSGDPTVVFTQVVRMIGELFKVRVVCLSEIVGQELHFKAVYADGCVITDAGCCPLTVTPCATVQMDKDVRLFDRVMERFPQASFLRDHQAVSYCGFPALDGAGRMVAVTCLLDDKPHEFSDEEQDLLQIFGQRIAMEFERHHHVAEQQRVAEELRRSHAFLRQVIDTDPNFIFAKDREGRFTLVNKAIAEAYGTTVDSLIGKTDADFKRSRDEIELFRRNDLEVLNSLRELFIPEEKFTDATGHVRWLQTVKRPLLDDHGYAVMLLGASTDVTARKRVEEMLRQRERDLRAAVEERERINEDLHDGILQSIFAVGLGLESCRTLVSKLPLTRKKAATPLMAALNRAIGQLNHVMSDVRNFIAGIESHVLEEADIGETLRTMVQAMCASNGTACRVTIEEAAVRELSTEQAYHVVNVMREVLSNSIRHSGAGRITLSFKRLRRFVRLSATDNGKGFIPDSARDVGHGLINMAARARKLGGRIEVRSRPRQGTKVLLDIPRRPVDE